MTKNEPAKWDWHAIKAAIGRAGLTQVAIAKREGLEASVVRHGLRGRNRKGAEAIAKALGVPFRTLFPDSYLRGSADEINTSHKHALATSQKHHVRDDKISGAA